MHPMPKNLYEEALDEFKQLESALEDRARKRVMDTVTPMIKDMIEKQLLREGEEADRDDVEQEEKPEELNKPKVVQNVSEPPKGGKPGLLNDTEVKDECGIPGEMPQPLGNVRQECDTSVPEPAMSMQPDGSVTLNVAKLDASLPAAPQTTPASAGGSFMPSTGIAPIDVPLVQSPVTAGQATSIVLPNSEPPAPVDLDQEYELDIGADDWMRPVLGSASGVISRRVEAFMHKVDGYVKVIDEALNSKSSITDGFKCEISETIARVEDMYEKLQDAQIVKSDKQRINDRLEKLYEQLKGKQELTMQKKINEGDLKLTLTGLPDDIDLENVGVDIVEDEEGEEGELDLDLVDDEAADDGAEAGPSEEGGEDFNFGGEEDEELPESKKRARQLRESADPRNAIKDRLRKKLQEHRRQVQLNKRLHENSAVKQPADKAADESLREKLAEANLYNAKLLYTNRLLQNEQMSARQKSRIVERLDEAKSVREARLIFESATKVVDDERKPLSEQRERSVGSSSRPTTSGSANGSLNEGVDAARWAKLAGIK
jgi:hypothetical protein